MSRIYVVQNVLRVSYKTGELEPKYDLEPARRWGELIFLLDHTFKSYVPQQVNEAIAQVRQRLTDPGITVDDFILPLGDPSMIGVAIAIAADTLGGRLRILQWDKRRLDYEEIKIDLHPEWRSWGDVWA